nr:protein ENHANCED PSEUDOMONAS SUSCEPTIBILTY 1-like [Coffea arabica]
MESPTVQYVSQCFIKPKYTPEESKQPFYSSPWDVMLVIANYMQRGFVFAKPPGFDTDDENQLQELVQKLKESLSLTLVHFYPLAGRLVTQKKRCLTSWSEIFKAEGKTSVISRLPVHDRLFPRGRHNPFLRLPLIYDHDDQVIINRDEADILPADMIREKIFHFSSETVRKLKAKVNAERNATEISSLQTVSAHLWRCITRARNFPSDRKTSFVMVANARSKSVPPVPEDYFGNYLRAAIATAGCGELLEHGLGWAAWLLHQEVINQIGYIISQEQMESWLQSAILSGSDAPDPSRLLLAGSPRFNVYGIDFGLGIPLAVRTGRADKFDGKMVVSPGVEGGGSMDFEICLLPHIMTSLESDKEFMETVS